MPNILNVSPIIYDDVVITGEVFPFSEEKMGELRDTYRKSHLIKRNGDRLMAIPIKAKAPSTGGVKEDFDLSNDLSLVRSLAYRCLYNELYFRKCWISSANPLIYLKTKENILDSCIPKGVAKIKGLYVYPRYELNFRIINPLEKGAYVGLAISVGVSPRITINCYDLMRYGVPILGFYIGKPFEGKNPDLRPRFSTLGRVKGVNSDGLLELDDVREGEESTVDPMLVYLEPREDLLESCIRALYRENAPSILQTLEEKSMEYHKGDSKFKKINAALKGYQQFRLELVEGKKFSLGNFLDDNSNNERHVNIIDGGRPIFVYAHGGLKTNPYNDPGLQKYGPFSRDDFSPSKPHICIISQKKKRGQVEQVLHKFFNGLPPVPFGKGGNTFEFTGLKDKFRIQDITTEYFDAEDDSIESYNKAIGAALKASGNTKPFDLALVQIDDSFRARKPSENPYLVAKARFISQQVSVQEFTLESLGKGDDRIVWSLNNMALATYAKMGGIPWLLTAEAPMAHEIVFGIGSAMIHTSRLGSKERMVGITTVFKGDGRYFVNNISSAVVLEEYFETLLENLRVTVDRVKMEFNWRPKDTVRLIFHAFKEFADIEVNAVKQVMSELGEYNVEFAFVKVAQDHPYILFDTSQRGIWHKGVYAPNRGKFLQLSEHVSLVSLTGPSELKKPSDGLPHPIQLVLHRDSTFKDIIYISKQVIKFGAHSWRSYSPAPMPVSVYYSQLMAQMLSQLNGLSYWNQDSILNKIGTTRWFL